MTDCPRCKRPVLKHGSWRYENGQFVVVAEHAGEGNNCTFRTKDAQLYLQHVAAIRPRYPDPELEELIQWEIEQIAGTKRAQGEFFR